MFEGVYGRSGNLGAQSHEYINAGANSYITNSANWSAGLPTGGVIGAIGINAQYDSDGPLAGYHVVHTNGAVTKGTGLGSLPLTGGALWEMEGPWTIELVAGIVEEGEEKEAVAHRETKEEAGCDIMDLEYICEYLPSPGASSEKLTLYVGGIDATGVGGRHGVAAEGEDIWVQVYDRSEAWKASGGSG